MCFAIIISLTCLTIIAVRILMTMWFPIAIILTFLTIIAVRALTQYLKPKKKRVPTKDGWYGRIEMLKEGEILPSDNEEVHPFTIQVNQDVLDDLKIRLENTRLEEPAYDVKFHDGFNPTYMKEVIKYWKDEYSWRSQEKLLNQYPQFTTQIEGLRIHFIRMKPNADNDKVKVIPLMILHGWPSTCFEFLKIIPLLTTLRPGKEFVFEVICPSIPGYGFSEAPHRKGLDATAVGRIFVKLMLRIGHRKFFVHGGDWGSRIASNMSRFFPERVTGLHITMCSFGLRGIDVLKYIIASMIPLFFRPEEKFLAITRKKLKFYLQETGYFHMNSTKPGTLGCAMSDSPAGVAAYLLEKYATATNPDYLNRPDGGLTEKFTLDDLLTTVMISWVTNSFTAAARFYKENVKDVLYMISERYPVSVPSGIAVFPNEVMSYPRFALSCQMKNIVSYNIMPRGGHFAALEEPSLLADDIWNFVHTVNKL